MAVSIVFEVLSSEWALSILSLIIWRICWFVKWSDIFKLIFEIMGLGNDYLIDFGQLVIHPLWFILAFRLSILHNIWKLLDKMLLFSLFLEGLIKWCNLLEWNSLILPWVIVTSVNLPRSFAQKKSHLLKLLRSILVCSD